MQSFLTGLQPSGELHIGNYFGSVLPNIQHANTAKNSIIFLADLHALTTLKDKKLLQKYTQDLAISLIACGLDPKKTLIFRQSDVPAHSELAWILSTIAPMGMLERGHSFKDKKEKGIKTSVGLFTYPILMAADILLYSPDNVPVGKDQKQHLEMARDMATTFNTVYGGSVLKLPEPVISDSAGVIPGIDGQKMSKSYGNTIPLFGTPKQIRKKIMQITTDSTPVEDPKSTENCNIFALCKLFLSKEELTELEKKYLAGGMGYGEAKQILFEAVEAKFSAMWAKKIELEQDPQYIEKILEDAAKTANSIANRQLKKIKKQVGLG